MLIEIEGIDGAGKTLQCKLLKEHLTNNGYDAVVVKDLTSTRVGHLLRQDLLLRKTIPPAMEFHAFIVAKNMLFNDIIEPSLLQKKLVICDRGIGSFYSYFLAHDFHPLEIEKAIEESCGKTRPVCTFLIDTPIETAIDRCQKRGDENNRFDHASSDFVQKQQRHYLSLAEQFGWKIIDGNNSVGAISTSICFYMDNLLLTKK